MINSFLVSLQNSATQPVNPASPTGDVMWPPHVRVRTYAGAALLANRLLFANLPPTDFRHFMIAIQLLWVVEESVCADRIFADDARITYTPEQLVGQFVEQSTSDLQNTSRILRNFSSIPVAGFLTGRLLQVYRSALCKLDKLAAVICYFGERDGD